MIPARTKEPLAQPFAIHELELALSLNDSLPFRGTLVSVVTDSEVVPEAIEITPPRLEEPEWFMCKCNETGDVVVALLGITASEIGKPSGQHLIAWRTPLRPFASSLLKAFRRSAPAPSPVFLCDELRSSLAVCLGRHLECSGCPNERRGARRVLPSVDPGATLPGSPRSLVRPRQAPDKPTRGRSRAALRYRQGEPLPPSA
jgi:hypothetical protein